MPRLLLFAPFRSVIVDQADNVVTFVQLLERLNVPMPTDAEPPDDSGVPLKWAAAAVWLQEPTDDGVSYEQRVEVVRPDGKEVAKATIPFQMTSRTQRNTTRINGFSTSPPGEHQVRLWLRQADPETEWQLVSSYPVAVTYKPTDGV